MLVYPNADEFAQNQLKASTDFINAIKQNQQAAKDYLAHDFKAFFEGFDKHCTTLAQHVALSCDAQMKGISVLFPDKTEVSYAELNAEANRLARYLQKQHTEIMQNKTAEESYNRRTPAETPIGLLLDHSFDGVVCLLACMKAGLPFLFLSPYGDAKTESERQITQKLQNFIEASPLAFVLSMKKGKKVNDRSFRSLKAYFDSKSIAVHWLDTLKEELKQIESTPLGSTPKPEQLAFIVASSGSSGHPKLMLLEYRGIPQMAQSHIQRMGLTKESRFAQNADFGFISSYFEVFVGLWAGARLCMISPENRSSSQLNGIYNNLGITHSVIVASTLNILEPTELTTVQCILAMGERVPEHIIRKWCQQPNRNGQPIQFMIGYGLTEATTAVAFGSINDAAENHVGDTLDYYRAYLIPEEDHIDWQKKFNDTAATPQEASTLQWHVLKKDENTRYELAIAGLGVMRGYTFEELNRGTLLDNVTIELFDNDNKPLMAEDGTPLAISEERLFFTRDAFTVNADNQLVYLTRLDGQLKRAGVSVSASEVEELLWNYFKAQKEKENENPVKELYVVPYVSAFPQATTSQSSAMSQLLNSKVNNFFIAFAVITEEAKHLLKEFAKHRMIAEANEEKQMLVDPKVELVGTWQRDWLLKNNIPVHKQPLAWVVLDSSENLPKLLSNKVDKLSLITWAKEQKLEFVQARDCKIKSENDSPARQLLIDWVTQLWRQLLEIDDVISLSVDTNFAMCGGDSIKLQMLINLLDDEAQFKGCGFKQSIRAKTEGEEIASLTIDEVVTMIEGKIDISQIQYDKLKSHDPFAIAKMGERVTMEAVSCVHTSPLETDASQQSELPEREANTDAESTQTVKPSLSS